MARRDNQKLIQAWLDPEIPEDQAAVSIIEELNKNGWNNKQIIVDAINRASGHTPEMFADSANAQTATLVRLLRGVINEALRKQSEELLEQFGNELLNRIREEGLESFAQHTPQSPFDTGGGEKTAAMQKFASGFLARRQQVRDGNENEDD